MNFVNCIEYSYGTSWKAPEHGYVCENSYGQFRVVDKDCIRNHRRLHLPEIVSRLEEVRHQVFSNKVGPALRQMAASVSIKTHAHSACVGQLIAAVCAFFEQIKNWFLGNGFRTTVERALQLAEDYDASVALSVDQRAFTRDPQDPNSDPIPIQLRANDFLNNFGNQFDPKECNVITNGSFTYKKAKLAEGQIPVGKEELYDDDAPGNNWRAILNQINNFKQFCASKMWFPKPEYDREIGMHDIEEWTTCKTEPLDSLDALVLMYQFIRKAYRPRDREAIYSTFLLQGYLFFDADYSILMKEFAIKHAKRSDQHELLEAAHAIWDIADEDNIFDPNINEHVKIIRKEFEDEIRPHIDDTIWEGAWLAYLIAFHLCCRGHKLDDFCKSTYALRSFDCDTPILAFGDSQLATNIYGIRQDHNEGVTDFFTANSESFFNSPWNSCGWQNAQKFTGSFGGNSKCIMVLTMKPR